MIQVHSIFLNDLKDFLTDHPSDDKDANRLLNRVNTYIDNQAEVNEYQAETLAFITKELTN